MAIVAAWVLGTGHMPSFWWPVAQAGPCGRLQGRHVLSELLWLAAEAKRDFGIYRSEVEINKAAIDKARHVPNTTACELGNVKSGTSAKAVVACANA